MKSIISIHNKKVLGKYHEQLHPSTAVAPHCNCQARFRGECPMPGQCCITDVVYRAQLPIPPPAPGQQNNNRSEETYTGCSVNFKKRFGKHKRSVRVLEEKQTTFSTYIWQNFNNNGEEGRLQALQDTRWTPITRARPYNPGNGKCNLCLTEKWFIMFRPEGASLNQRSEIFSHCYHKEPQLLKNFKSVIKWIHFESCKCWASEW